MLIASQAADRRKRMKTKKQMNSKLKIGMLLLIVALVVVPGASAYPGQTNACNGCHNYPPTTIKITTNVTSITVNPGQSFTVQISWSGGNPSGTTEVNWPTTFTNIGITRDNTLFNPTPRIPASVLNTASGTTSSTLTAPSATGTYTVRVYASRASPWETDYKDITVNVQAPPAPVLTTITVSPSTASKVVGGTQTFTAAGYDQNGATIAISPAVVWSSSNTTVGTINSAGVFTALAPGTATITARNGTSGTVSGTASVTVTAPAPVLKTITVSPATASKVVGGTQTFTATGYDQNGASIAISPAVVWSSSNTTVGTINSAGVFTALAPGTATITARNGTSGTVSGTASVTVTAPAPVLKTITVSPSTASKVVGGMQTFTATGYDQNGATMAISPAVVWSSSNTTVGTINSAGVFTALAPGTSTITARNGTSGTVSGTASVAVTQPASTLVLTTITVSPSTASKVVGETQTFTAAGYDQNGGSIAISPTVVWSSSNTTVGTINSAGVFTALAPGTTTITATNGTGGTVSGTASVAVLAPVPVPLQVLTTVTISPLNPSIVAGTTKQFSATTLDQNNAPIGATLSWASSNTAVGTINSAGLFTALKAGTTTITVTATNGTVTKTASTTAIVTRHSNRKHKDTEDR